MWSLQACETFLHFDQYDTFLRFEQYVDDVIASYSKYPKILSAIWGVSSLPITNGKVSSTRLLSAIFSDEQDSIKIVQMFEDENLAELMSVQIQSSNAIVLECNWLLNS